MILTQTIPAKTSKPKLDDLNLESGRIYSQTLFWHWRIIRRQDLWLLPSKAEKLNDSLNGGSTLHSHSVDAAQQAFYKACKTIKQLRKAGDESARYPWKRKRYRTTIWKNSGIRVKDGVLLLSLSQGNKPIEVRLPLHLRKFDKSNFKEVRLVFNHKRKHYDWHMVIDDGIEMPDAPGRGLFNNAVTRGN